MQINPKNYFGYFMFHPRSDLLTRRQKNLSTIGTIAFGLLTLGLGHLICFLTLHNPKDDETIKKLLEERKIDLSSPIAKFLLNDKYQWEEKDADLGFETEFGVLWINHENNKKFVEEMRNKYSTEITTVNPTVIHKYFPADFTKTGATRFANNNINCLFFMSMKEQNPKYQAMLRDSLRYILLHFSTTCKPWNA